MQRLIVSTGCSSCNCPANAEAVWNLGTLAAGESRTISVNALVAVVLDGNLDFNACSRNGDRVWVIRLALFKTVAVSSAPASRFGFECFNRCSDCE